MTFQEIIQQPGRMVDTNVYYIKPNGGLVLINKNSVESVKHGFNAPLIGTAIKYCELSLKDVITPENEIYIRVNASFENNSTSVTYGPFFAKENPSYDANEKTYTHECYGEMLFMMKPYEKLQGITYPCRVIDYLEALSYQMNFSLNFYELPNGERIMQQDIYDGIDFTYRDVLEDIAVANAVCFKLEDNELSIIKMGGEYKNNPPKSGFTKAGTRKAFKGTFKSALINDDILKNTNIEFGEHFGPINSVILSRSADSDFIYKRDETTDEWHEFRISDNQLLNGNDRDEYLPAIYSTLFGIEYDIFDTQLVGYGGFKELESVKFETGNNIYNSYVFNWENDLTNGYEETIYNEMPEENVPDYPVSDETDKAVKEASIIVNKKISEVDIKGKTIDLTADDIDIISNNFRITRDGTITSLKGFIGGWEITDDGLRRNITPPYDYSNEDIDKIRNYLGGTYTPTEQEMRKFDVNSDGKVDLSDLTLITKLIKYNLMNSRPGYLLLNTNNWFQPIQIVNSSGQVLAYFGVDGAGTYN